MPTMPTPVAPETTLVHTVPLPHYSYGTHRSTHMAFCSGFLTYIDYAIDTFAEFSIPTSPPSTSTTD